MDCGIPYCHTGCPVNNQIPDWNDLVYRGNWQEAARNLHSTNNFPEVTGRICPAPCEASCTLNLNDNPVTIPTAPSSRGWIEPEPPSQKSGKKVAVVGSGPAGMAYAQQNGSEQGGVPDSGFVYGGISSTAHFFFCERCFLSKKA